MRKSIYEALEIELIFMKDDVIRTSTQSDPYDDNYSDGVVFEN